MSALCVFHDNRTPSLSVNLETGAFRCFACGAKGSDILAFHRLRYGLSFEKAHRSLEHGDKTCIFLALDKLADGTVIGEIRRYIDENGEKQDIPCYTMNSKGFEKGIPGELKRKQYPLFGLDTIADINEPIFVVEGQKMSGSFSWAWLSSCD